MDKLRIDKWLWAARFFKTRTLACDEIDKGRVQVNGAAIKPAREIKAGDVVQLRQGVVSRTVNVLAVSDKRGSAPIAALLYRETPESLDLRSALAEQHRLAPEPALSFTGGRPTKKNRRLNSSIKGQTGEWDSRWTARIRD